MKTRLRTEGELQKMANYLNETYNIEGNQYVSLAFPSHPSVVSLKEALKLYFRVRMWLKKDEEYRKFRGDRFCLYFELN